MITIATRTLKTVGALLLGCVLFVPAGAAQAQTLDEIIEASLEAAGGRAVVNTADVADWEQSAAMVQQAVETFGGLDILVNNAGFVRDRRLVNTSEEEWDAVIRVLLKGHFAPLRHAGSYWRDESKAGRPRAARGINTSSGAGLQGSVGQSAYSAAKAGVAGLTLVAAQEMGRYGVTVNAIAPGYIRTDNTAALQDDETRNRQILERIPAGRWGEASDLGGAAVFLASRASAYVTGTVVTVDGGWMAR